MSPPFIRIGCVANLYSRMMHFKNAGDTEQGHTHQFDHLTLLASGRLRLTALGTSTEFKAPQHIFIKAGVVHELEALENDTVVHCIHGIREKGCEDIVDPASLPEYAFGLDERKYPMTEGMA